VLTAEIRPVGVHSFNHINITDLYASVERFWLTDALGTNPPEVPIRSKEEPGPSLRAQGEWWFVEE